MNKKDIMDSCKDQLKIHIEVLLEAGERVPVIEIELLHFIKKMLYTERN